MKPVDFRLRPGSRAARDAYNLRRSRALLETETLPITLRIPLEAFIPVGPGDKRQYRRIDSYLLDCHSEAAVRHVQTELRRLMLTLDGARLVDQEGNWVSFRPIPKD